MARQSDSVNQPTELKVRVFLGLTRPHCAVKQCRVAYFNPYGVECRLQSGGGPWVLACGDPSVGCCLALLAFV